METLRNAVIVFNNGEYLTGTAFGSNANETHGELCFNTAATGYQEILTDPSYAKQIIVFSFPHIGNVGTNNEDCESSTKPITQGAVFREVPTNASNHRATNGLEHFMKSTNILAICNVDTRYIVSKIRKGEFTSCIISRNIEEIPSLIEKVKTLKSTKGMDLASESSCTKPYQYCSGQKNIAVIDYGIKENILRILQKKNMGVHVFPCNASYEDIMKTNPCGVLLSNGPGDPCATLPHTKNTIIKIMQSRIPMFGICLGHQLIALTLGAKVEKLEQGHRGTNHPVMNYTRKSVKNFEQTQNDEKQPVVEITTQNHGFACLDDNIPSYIQITHRSLFDGVIEGISLKTGIDIELDGHKIFNTGVVFSVQYHPESSGGPHDSMYLFNNFISNLN